MGDVITFTPRPKPAAPLSAPEPLTPADPALRARIEAAAEVAVDTAKRLIAILDRMDGCPDDEDGQDAEPSLAAPEEPGGNQVGWCRGGDEDRETGAPEVPLPEIAVLDAVAVAAGHDPAPAPGAPPEPRPEAIVIPLSAIPHNGRGSMVTAAAITLFDLVAGEG